MAAIFRTEFKRQRSAPYPQSQSKQKELPRGDSDSTWDHKGFELFEGGSSLYNPKVSQLPISKPLHANVSPSFAPFGAHTPVSQPENYHQPTSQPAQRSDWDKQRSLADRMGRPTESASLLTRISVDLDSLSPTAKRKLARSQTNNRKNMPDVPDWPSAAPASAPSQTTSRAQTDSWAVPEAVAPTTYIVRVANLVEGTSAEDVKTAFSQFGTISNAKIARTFRNTQGRTLLVAEVTFSNEKDAQAAVDTLNGALADGESLEVTVVKNVPQLPTQTSLLNTSSSSRSTSANLSRSQAESIRRPASQPQAARDRRKDTSSSSMNLFERMGMGTSGPAPSTRSPPTSNGPRGDRNRNTRPAQQQEAINNATQQPAPTSNSMRADELAAIDPRSSYQNAPTQIKKMTAREIRDHSKWAKDYASANRSLASRLAPSGQSTDMDLS